MTTTRAETAKQYEKVHNWFFLLRLVLTAVLLAWFQLSGASQQLTELIQLHFGTHWAIVNGAYILLASFAYSALLFPLSLYTDHLLEHHYELSKQSFGSWLGDFFKSLVLDLVMLLIFFEVIYALLQLWPNTWWLLATGFYILFAVLLSAIFPTLIMPLFNKFEPLDDTALTKAITQLMTAEGIKVVGVYTWGLGEKTVTGNAAFTGIGKSRRIILGDTLLKDYSHEEIMAILAHEVGHYKNRDMLRLCTLGTLLAFVGFFCANQILVHTIPALGGSSVADITFLPLFLFALFIFSTITMPISNIYSRVREYAADAYAVRSMGTADHLSSAFEKLADQNLSDKTPNPIIEFLLHSHPSMQRRIEAAQRLANQLKKDKS